MRLNTRERHARQAAAQREARKFSSDAKAFEADRIMREYEKAYAACNGRDIQLMYASGWVRGKGIANTYRLGNLERMTQALWARVHEQEIQPEAD
jgi:hypothetical protein